MKSKKLITSLLTISMLASTVVPAFAAESNEVVDPLPGTGYTKITVEVKDSSGGGDSPDVPPVDPPVDPTDIIIATVPVELPIIMDLEGNITVPTDATIINHSTDKGIKVTDISVSLDPSWTAANFTDDFSTKADDTKEIGLSFRGDTLTADGTFPITDGNWNIAKNSNLPLNMAAKLPKHTTESKGQAATVGFTIGWSGLDGTDGGSDPDAGKDNSGGSGEVNPPAEASPDSWFTYSGNTITGLSDEYLNMVDAPTDLVLPDNAGGQTLTAIAANAFANRNLITSIVIPNSIKSIGFEAFKYCNNATIILEHMPQRVDGAPWGAGSANIIWSIPAEDWDTNPVPASWMKLCNISWASTGVIQAKSVGTVSGMLNIPTSIGGIKVTGIGEFKSCENLIEVTIPCTITEIPDYAFSMCPNLKTVNIPESVTSIGIQAFSLSGTSSNLDLLIPSTVTSIADYAFWKVPHITYNGTATGSPWGALSIN